MNAFDTLLRWASEVGSSSWQCWGDTAHYLGLEPSGAARALSDLGHVEFDWVANRFAAAPPTAILLPRSSGCILITGARPGGLRKRIEALATNGEFDVEVYPEIAQTAGPATWLAEGRLDDFGAFCGELGIAYAVQSGRQLVGELAVANIQTAALREHPTDRLPRDWFDESRRTFRSTARTATPDVWWRVHEARRKAYYVYKSGEWYRVPVREYAPYLACRASTFLCYNESAKTLSVDSLAPLPPLLARAATLQSGRLPLRGEWLGYVNVDGDLAEAIASRLGLPFQGI